MKVSVIIPMFNVEEYISRCISSVIAQDYRNIEIIIVDDHSTDKSLEICKKIMETDNRIRIFPVEGNGVSAARNTGVEKATGEWISFLDSDDEYEENFISKMIQEMKKNESQMVVCGYQLIGEDSKSEKKSNYQELSSIEYLNEIVSNRETEDLANYPWNKLYVKEILLNNNIAFNETISVAEDALFNMKYLQYIDKITIIDEVLNRHYIREESLVNSIVEVEKQKETLLMIFEEYEKNYFIRKRENEYKELMGKKLLFYFLRLCSVHHGKDLKNFIKEVHTKKYFKYIKNAECINVNYRIFKILYCLKLNYLLYIFSEIKSK